MGKVTFKVENKEKKSRYFHLENESNIDIMITLSEKEIKDFSKKLEKVRSTTLKITDIEEEIENLVDLFWIMLQTIESKVKPEEDLLDKINVEGGYRLWNKIFKSDLQPRWLR